MQKKYYNYLSKHNKLELYFPLLKKSTGIIVSTKRRPDNPIIKFTNINTNCYIYIFIVFTIIIYLDSTYILIYIYEIPINIMNLIIYLGNTN